MQRWKEERGKKTYTIKRVPDCRLNILQKKKCKEAKEGTGSIVKGMKQDPLPL